MNPRITIIATGEKLDGAKVQSAIEGISDLKVKKIGQERGITEGAVKAFKWIGEFIGGSSKIADALIDQTTKQFAGASIEIQVGGTVVKVSNATRSQVIELLDKAAQIAKESKQL